jgi:hypothetical protein
LLRRHRRVGCGARRFTFARQQNDWFIPRRINGQSFNSKRAYFGSQVVAEYFDSRKSGLTIKGRPAISKLLTNAP